MVSSFAVFRYQQYVIPAVPRLTSLNFTTGWLTLATYLSTINNKDSSTRRTNDHELRVQQHSSSTSSTWWILTCLAELRCWAGSEYGVQVLYLRPVLLCTFIGVADYLALTRQHELNHIPIHTRGVSVPGTNQES